jgi:hypothetical protein
MRRRTTPQIVFVALTPTEADEIALAASVALDDTGFVALPDTSRTAIMAAVGKLYEARSGRHPRALASKGMLALGAVMMAGALALGVGGVWPGSATPAAAASPFDDETYRAAIQSGGWHCTPAAPHEVSCTSRTGDTGRIRALKAEGQTRFVGTGVVRGRPIRIVLAVFDAPDDAARFLDEAQAWPDVYPHLYSGDRWVAWSTDPVEVEQCTRALHRRPRPPSAPQRGGLA